MTIGLIDVDGHRFPNLALMRISTWHKAKGDHVEWWLGDLFHYDRVYMSKVFSDVYSKDMPDPVNCDEVIRGGTGYCIQTVNGREVFDKQKDRVLPDEVEHMFPDYSLYPQYDFAVAMTSRGCPRGCPFCHVVAKEGRGSRKVADVKDFYAGQKRIQVLDPNITACPEKRDLFRQYMQTSARVCFNQGLDIRLLDDDDIADINRMKIDNIHFAWDNPKEDLTAFFERYVQKGKPKCHGMYGTVYVLTNYNSSLEEDLWRIYTLRQHYNPYVMIYNKPSAPQEIRLLQRWCNNKIVFKTVPRFEDYDRRKG